MAGYHNYLTFDYEASNDNQKASGGPLLVAAIDFGTTYSGWAFSFVHEFRSDPTKCNVKHWYSGTGSVVTEKTPTCALIKPDGKTLEAFGYDAENKYSELIENDEHEDYYYFRRFKMALDRENIYRHLLITDEMGKSLPAITVFALSIEFLSQDLLDTGRKNVGDVITMDDVHWVLTVPAIWSEASKQFMREAAVKAGIRSKKLSIALEPEAASIFCRHLPVEKNDSEETISSLAPGAKYMILDAGGGTIDITVHQVTKSGGLREVHAASGGGWGGILVDNAFKDLLQEIFGPDVYGTFVHKMTEDWLDLWRTFESKKKLVDPDSKAPVNMRLPASLLKLFKKKTGEKFEDVIENSSFASKIETRGGDKVRLDSKLMNDLFKISVDTTISHVKSIFKEENAKNIRAILMVGGFSESVVLQKAIKKEFRNLKIIIPREASSSILRGAVAFGHDPNSISQRVLKRTYGIQTSKIFQEGMHPEHLKYLRNGEEHCKNIFSKHVEVGQSVNVGESQVEKSYLPAYEQQNEIRFNVYASQMKNPLYTDQGCDHVGEFRVDIANLPEYLKREQKRVIVSLTFSGTEITATARVEKTGEITSAKFDFLN